MPDREDVKMELSKSVWISSVAIYGHPPIVIPLGKAWTYFPWVLSHQEISFEIKSRYPNTMTGRSKWLNTWANHSPITTIKHCQNLIKHTHTYTYTHDDDWFLLTDDCHSLIIQHRLDWCQFSTVSTQMTFRFIKFWQRWQTKWWR